MRLTAVFSGSGARTHGHCLAEDGTELRELDTRNGAVRAVSFALDEAPICMDVDHHLFRKGIPFLLLRVSVVVRAA